MSSSTEATKPRYEGHDVHRARRPRCIAPFSSLWCRRVPLEDDDTLRTLGCFGLFTGRRVSDVAPVVAPSQCAACGGSRGAAEFGPERARQADDGFAIGGV